MAMSREPLEVSMKQPSVKSFESISTASAWLASALVAAFACLPTALHAKNPSVLPPAKVQSASTAAPRTMAGNALPAAAAASAASNVTAPSRELAAPPAGTATEDVSDRRPRVKQRAARGS
jgi:hypothetical protein